MMTKKIFYFLAVLLLASCGEKEEKEQPVQMPEEVEVSALKVTPESFANLADWTKDNVNEAVEAFKLSCPKILQENGEYLGLSRIKVLTAAYQEACRVLPMYKPEQYREFLEKNFIPYAISYNGNFGGQFTSYYEVMFRASRYKRPEFAYPVYGRPADMLEVNLQDFDKSLPKKQLVGRLVGQKLVPYYTRKEINNPALHLRAPALLYVSTPIDSFIAQIQGSALAVLDDGSYQRLAYAGNNGWPFKGIGSILLENKVLAKNELNMIRIKQWLNENSHKAEQYMNENPRYVFHRLVNSNGPLGAQGVALTAGRSLAVDPDYIPLGSLLWLETSYPDKGKLGKLVVAQDVGSAIKGPIRGDYFWGSGGDEVLRLAGSMNSGGRYYLLVPKNAEVKVQ